MKQLLKFSAEWCDPCRILSNNFKYVNLDKVELINVDVEEQPDMVKQYEINGTPTLILLEDGKEVKRNFGVLMVYQIEEFIK